MIILKYIRYFFAGVFIALTGPFIILYCCLRPGSPENLYPVSRFIGHGWRKIFGFKMIIKNQDNFEGLGNFIIISNHQSNIDIITCGLTVPKRTVAVGKKSLGWIPVFGQIFWLTGNILLDRSKKAAAKKFLIDTANTMVEKNVSLWIMPEGTRNHGGGLLPFKKGPFFTAIQAQVPIIPVSISSVEKHINLNKWDAGTIMVQVLEPISTKGMSEKDVPHLAALCQHVIREGIEKVNLDIDEHLKNKES
tara:strand:- start:310 stop:1056 length:747 start_codon:yes stop_codon:yes gene_type:complete